MCSPSSTPTLGLKEGLLLRLARRWISGVDLDSALKDVRDANLRGLNTVVNYLGEDITDPSIADSHAEEYLRLQRAIAEKMLKGCVSVKLTQFGLASDEHGARRRLNEVVAEASRLRQSLWIDMESSKFVDETLKAYSEHLKQNARLGVALQSYMRRSESDLNDVLNIGGRVRLVKGAYKEPLDIAFGTRAETTRNYSKLMRILFDRGDNFVIGTHDPKLIKEAKELAGRSHANFEFQMLKGIQDGLKDELAKSGYRVGEYLPYGDRWYVYSKRRIREHPSNILLLVRSLF